MYWNQETSITILLHTMIPSIQQGGSKIIASTESTAMKSPEGHIATGDTAYSRKVNNNFITLNDNSYLDNPGIVASPIKRNKQNVKCKVIRDCYYKCLQ